MIYVTLIDDIRHYQSESLRTMREIFSKDFIQHKNPELAERFNPDSPEVRIHIGVPKGVFPENLFGLLSEDLNQTIAKEKFISSLLSPKSEGIPSLVFHFEGEFRSFEFIIKAKDKSTMLRGTKNVIGKLLGMVESEEIPPESEDVQKLVFEDGEWVKTE